MHVCLHCMCLLQVRTEDSLRYQSNVFMSDVKAFKQQPLQMMMKKSNLALSDRMFVGTWIYTCTWIHIETYACMWCTLVHTCLYMCIR